MPWGQVLRGRYSQRSRYERQYVTEARSITHDTRGMRATDDGTKEVTLERVLVFETKVCNDCRFVLADSVAMSVKRRLG